MITAIAVVILLAVVLRPMEKWEGSITARANETKVPREIVLAVDLACIPLMVLVTLGLPSAVFLTPFGEVTDAIGFKDILSEMIFWAISGVLAYFAVSIARILISHAWSFFGFASFRLYSWGGWKAIPAYLVLPFVILGPVTKAVNLMLEWSMAGVLSGFDGKVNYAPIMFFTVFFNVVLVLNGILKAPSQGQYYLQYLAEMVDAVKDANVNIVRARGQLMIPTELPLLTDIPDTYKEIPRVTARGLLAKVNPKARKFAPYLLQDPDGNVALSPQAGNVIDVSTGNTVDLSRL